MFVLRFERRREKCVFVSVHSCNTTKTPISQLKEHTYAQLE